MDYAGIGDKPPHPGLSIIPSVIQSKADQLVQVTAASCAPARPMVWSNVAALSVIVKGKVIDNLGEHQFGGVEAVRPLLGLSRLI